jgi:hypothetical protein
VKYRQDYFEDGSQRRYGVRFERTLRAAYQNLGADAARNAGNLTPTVGGRMVGDRLAEALRCPEGPVKYIENIRSTWNNAYLNDFGLDRAFLEEEHFGMYLWLRVQDEPGHPQYAIKMIGSSVSAHREEWSFQKRADIQPNSTWAAASALFKGMVEFQNVTEAGRWRSVIAVPLYHSDPPDDMHRLSIGAVTFNSTHELHNSADLIGFHRDRKEIKAALKPSAISLFDVAQRKQLADAVHRAGLISITADLVTQRA